MFLLVFWFLLYAWLIATNDCPLWNTQAQYKIRGKSQLELNKIVFSNFRFLYTTIHKKHHEWQATVAYAAIYAHPIGKIFSFSLGWFINDVKPISNFYPFPHSQPLIILNALAFELKWKNGHPSHKCMTSFKNCPFLKNDYG